MANKVMYGLSDVAYAVFDDKTNTYGAWVSMPGASQLGVSAEGSSDTTFADNVPYYVANKNSGYSGSFTTKMLPEAFYTDVLGEVKDEETGGIYEDTSAVPKTVALRFKVNGNVNDEATVFYNVSFARPAGDHATNEDSLSIHDISLDYKAIGRDMLIDGSTVNVVKMTVANSTENATKYKQFVTKVTLPAGATIPGATPSV